MKIKQINKYFVWGITLFIIFLVPFVAYNFSYIMTILIMVWIYATLGQSWNILGGYAKQFSLGQAAFFGLGAFITAYICNAGIYAVIALLLATISVAILSIFFGVILFSTKGAYFAIVTLALAEILKNIFLLSTTLSGSEGVILKATFFSHTVPLYYLSVFIAIVSFMGTFFIQKSNFGLSLLAIGNDESAAEELGVDVKKTKTIMLIMSAAMAALAGGLYTFYIQYLSPADVFSIKYSLDAILICYIGAIEMPLGPLAGALFLSILDQTLNPLFPSMYMLLLGVVLIIILFFLPNGLLSILIKPRFLIKSIFSRRKIKIKDEIRL